MTAAKSESFEELCERFHELAASAVDPLEIAAALESDGLSDQAARVRYDFRDVFALAERMYGRVPRNPVEPEALPDPWHVPPFRCVLHALLYAMPALCFPIAAPLLGGGLPLVLLVIAMVVSWSASQGMSYLGYVRLGRLDAGGSRRLLRGGLLVCALLLGAVVAGATVLLGVAPAVALIAGGQGLYLLAATVLLVTGADLWLLAGLAPAVLVSASYLLAGQPSGAFHLVTWIALGGSLLAVTATAVVRGCWPRPAPARRLRAAELRAALPYAAFGALVAGLLVFPLLAARFSSGGLGASSWVLLATLPLSLSMGAAEWLLYWYRRQIGRVLRATRVVADFSLRALVVLASALVCYLAATAVLMSVLVVVITATGHRPNWPDLLSYGGYVAVGGALFVALLMQAFGAVWAVLCWCLGAIVVEALLVITAPGAPALGVQLVIGVGLLWALLVHAGILLGRATRHQ
ncbi:MAG TPA: hypothetical protein VG317_11025 [Pseudonocardiaceae bacterium]|nr:hypothetical protein [Pseudonocardiaceae bacterium]